MVPPVVFEVTIVTGLQGEYQICNGYGKDKATQVMNVRKLKDLLYFLNNLPRQMAEEWKLYIRVAESSSDIGV